MEREEMIARIDLLFRDIGKKFSNVMEMRFDGKITFGEFIFLRRLKETGTSNASYLAQSLHVSMSHITNLCDKLIEKGYVFRRKSSEDRRILEIGLTERGEALLQEVIAIRLQFLEEYFQDLSNEELQHMAAIYSKLHQRLNKLEAESSEEAEA